MSVPGAFQPVIGLETHVQLKTRTKMFCGCRNLFGAPPNSLTCPVCAGMPGALPRANRAAFELAIRVGLALGGSIAHATRFDRKNYFYPDLPKGYQISQLEQPIVTGGSLQLESGRSIRITRAHLEEDAGKGIHKEEAPQTLIDLNRAGVPLLEIVTEPDIRSAREARLYLKHLKLLLKHLAVSDCDMEKGSLRCDVNVSLRRPLAEHASTRTEIKNLNSFKAVERAIDHEIGRQARLLDAGLEISQATLLWDEDRGETRLMRSKEATADYRYFADPDLPGHVVDQTWIDAVRDSLPELPWDRVARYCDDLGLSPCDAWTLVQDPDVASYFDAVALIVRDARRAASWITSDLFALVNAGSGSFGDSPVSPGALGRIIALVEQGKLSTGGGRRLLAAVFESGGDPDALLEELALSQVSDRASLERAVRQAVAANPAALADLKAGKRKAAGAIIGHVMKATRGRANPALVQEILQALLDEA